MNNKLDFLSEVLDFKEEEKHLLFPFFKSDFNSNEWNFIFDEKNKIVIDFNVLLSDGILLTSKQHYRKLNTLKFWIVQSLYENNNYRGAIKTIKAKIYRILNIFDYTNSNDTNKEFSMYGFEGLDTDYWISLLTKYSLTNDSERFDTGRYILDYYNKKKLTNHKTLQSLNNNQIQEVRAYLSQEKKSVNSFFSNMLVKRNIYPKLLQTKKQNLYTEFESFFRNSEETTMSETTFGKYLKELKVLLSCCNDLSNEHHSIPNKEFLQKAMSLNYTTIMNKRFETYPSQHLFKILETAIEFHYEFGDKIVNHYIENIKCNKKTNNIKIDKKNSANYFLKIRNNESEYHLLKVYYGVVQFVVGALMARRQSELLSLTALNCLDESEEFLIFNRSKSSTGLFGVRGVYKLPIDELAVTMIKNLQKIHIACNSSSPLFNMPNSTTHIISSLMDTNEYNNHLDIFFDYIEAPVIGNKRLYIRQHQLRRFFALSFFWGSGFGSLDTLRWFLGHTDIKHVYHYITESVSGEVLNSVKSQYVAENIGKYEDLLTFVKSKYQTESLDLLDTNSLMEYINEMLDQNLIEIEPEFLSDNAQNRYEIMVKIKEKLNG